MKYYEILWNIGISQISPCHVGLPEGTLLVALAFAATDEVAVRDATGGGAGARAAGRAGAASSAGSAGSEGSAGAPGAKPHIGYQDCSVNFVWFCEHGVVDSQSAQASPKDSKAPEVQPIHVTDFQQLSIQRTSPKTSPKSIKTW